MNQYGSLAQQMWTRSAPSEVAQMENPEEFFTELGEQVQTRIEVMVQEPEAQLPADLEAMERVRRLNEIRRQAEEVALSELVYEPVGLAAASAATPSTRLEEALANLPGVEALEDGIWEIEDQAQREAEDQGWERPLFDQEQEEKLARYRELSALVDVDPQALSQSEQEERLRLLAPYLEMDL